MLPKAVTYPEGANQYLRETFGLPGYSGKHLDRLVARNAFPAPITISPKRRVSLIADLDAHAERVLTKPATKPAA